MVVGRKGADATCNKCASLQREHRFGHGLAAYPVKMTMEMMVKMTITKGTENERQNRKQCLWLVRGSVKVMGLLLADFLDLAGGGCQKSRLAERAGDKLQLKARQAIR
jgi:hypothetical protein